MVSEWHGKWPRIYAREIANLKTKEERAEALERVPEHLSALVKAHVETTWLRRKWVRVAKRKALSWAR
jgi:hypothetical protein